MPRGRMLNKKISQDTKVAQLSLKATLLYTWCIPYLDCRGRMYGDRWTLKSIIPHITEITPEHIPNIIKGWIKADLVYHYGDDAHKYLQFKGFDKNQTLREGREAESEIPAPAELRSNSSGTTAKVKLSKEKRREGKSGVRPVDNLLRDKKAIRLLCEATLSGMAKPPTIRSVQSRVVPKMRWVILQYLERRYPTDNDQEFGVEWEAK